MKSWETTGRRLVCPECGRVVDGLRMTGGRCKLITTYTWDDSTDSAMPCCTIEEAEPADGSTVARHVRERLTGKPVFEDERRDEVLPGIWLQTITRTLGTGFDPEDGYVWTADRVLFSWHTVHGDELDADSWPVLEELADHMPEGVAAWVLDRQTAANDACREWFHARQLEQAAGTEARAS